MGQVIHPSRCFRRMNQPKPKQIRLPFSVPRPGRSKGTQRTCGICRRQEGKYTCPRCNLVYCSLACFQAQKHAQCSEPFYKSTVMDQIATDPKVGMDDKKEMIEMLRRFEKQGEEDDGLNLDQDGDEDEEEEDELEEKLRGIDLEEIDTNKLFHLLPQAHRDAFLAAIRDPESEAGKELLSTINDDEGGTGVGDEIVPTDLPWWECPEVPEDPEDDDEEGFSYANDPEPLESGIMEGVVPPAGVGYKLVYNALAICFAYIHVLLAFRLPSLDDFYLKDSSITPDEIKNELKSIVPLLFDQKSTTRYENPRDAYSSVWERIGSDPDQTPDQSILVRLIGIVGTMVHPPITTDPPRLLLVLADLYRLLARPKIGPVAKKLIFYTAALGQLDRQDWLRIEKDLGKEVEKLEVDDPQEPVDDEIPQRENLLL